MKKLVFALAIAASVNCFAESELDLFVSGLGPETYISDSSVTNVRNFAFSDNRSIRKIVLPEVVDVGTGAFRGCIALESIIIPRITDVGRFNGIFSGCYSLKEVILSGIEFHGKGGLPGFPWQVSNREAVFTFANGKFDVNGNPVSVAPPLMSVRRKR